MLKTERIRDFYEAAYLQYYLGSKGYPLIYIDEFHVSMHTEEFYNWSPVSTKALITMNPSSWTMSFWVAFSEKKIEAIIAWSKSINTKIFTWFISDLWNSLRMDSRNMKNACLIFDNSSVHTNAEIVDFSLKGGLRWITIPPYSPQLNPCEKIIAVIKKKLKTHWLRDEPLNLNIMKKIIDEVDENTWRGWIESAKIEIYNKMMRMKNAT